MTQDVNIVGIDQLPTWATEKTLRDILRYFRENRGISDETAKKLEKSIASVSKGSEAAAALLAEAAEDIADAIEDTGPRGQGSKKDARETARSLGGFRSAIKGISSDMTDFGGGLLTNITGFQSASRHLYGFNNAISATTNQMGLLGKSVGRLSIGLVGLATGLVGNLIRIVMDTANVFTQLNERGFRQITTVSSLLENLDELSMTSEQFQKVMENFSTAMGTFGQDSLANLIGRSTEVNQELAKFGLTTADASEFAAEYLQQQRLSGIFENIDNARSRRAFLDNLRNLSAFSTMLNVSRQEIAKTQTDFLKQDRIRAVLLQDSTGRASGALRQMVGFFAGFGDTGKAVIDMLGDMASVADPTMALDKYSVALSAAPEAIMGMMQTVRDVRDGLVDDKEATRRSIRFNMALSESADRLSYLGQLTQDQATIQLASQAMTQKEVIARLRASKKTEMTEEQIREELIKRAETEAKLVESTAQFNDMLNRTRRLFERFVVAFFSSFFGDENDIDNQFKSAMDYITEKGNEFGNTIRDLIGDKKTPGGLIGGLFRALWGLVSGETNNIISVLINGLLTVSGFIVGGLFSAVDLLIDRLVGVLSKVKIFNMRIYDPEKEEKMKEGAEIYRDSLVRRGILPHDDSRNPDFMVTTYQPPTFFPDKALDIINGVAFDNDFMGQGMYGEFMQNLDVLPRIAQEQKTQQERLLGLTERLIEATENSKTALDSIATNTARN